MWEWLQQNAQVVSSLGTIFTLFVWLIWLSLMYADFKAKRRPRLVIHQTHGMGPESHCLLVNLSPGAIHVQCVMAVAIVDGEAERSLTLGSESLDPSDLEPGRLEHQIGQGPLGPGEMLRLGNFEHILERLTGTEPEEGTEFLGPHEVGDVTRVEVRVVAVHGDDDRSFGARREFELMGQDDLLRVRPLSAHTEQLTSGRRQRMAEDWLRDCLQL